VAIVHGLPGKSHFLGVSPTLDFVQPWQNDPMTISQHSDRKTMREQVETLLPEWRTWYPSLFDAACDLGLLRARVCDLGSLVLSQRHASIQNEALQAFREKWSVEEPEELDGVQDSVQQAQGAARHKHHGKHRRR
jgi:hypothetical protein